MRPDESKSALYTHWGSSSFNLVCCLLCHFLFVAYYAISTLYAHVHEVNGTFIVHSHPFTEHHSHSSGQALTLHFLSTFTSVGSDSIESACPDLPLLCLLTGSLSAFHALSSFGDGIYLRAPPVYLFI